MRHYAFFQNRECEFFPCHPTEAPEQFNCLFCFCPLYHLGDQCDGDYVSREGVKDCSACTYPHDPDNYDAICARLKP